MVSAMQLAACYRRERVRSVWTCRASTLGTMPAKIYRVLIARFPFCQTAFCFDSADVLFDSVVINCREIEVKLIVGSNFQMAVKSPALCFFFLFFKNFENSIFLFFFHRSREYFIIDFILQFARKQWSLSKGETLILKRIVWRTIAKFALFQCRWKYYYTNYCQMKSCNFLELKLSDDCKISL